MTNRLVYFCALILFSSGGLNYAFVIQDYCSCSTTNRPPWAVCRSNYSSGLMKFLTPNGSTLVGGGLSKPSPNMLLRSSNDKDNNDCTKKDEVPNTATKKNRLPLIVVFFGSFATVTIASLAYALLMSPSSFSIELIGQDLGMGILVTILAGAYLKLWTTLVKMGVLDPKDSRKIIHTGSVPLFILFWPFFSVAPWSRFFAATVPWINVFRLVTAAQGSSSGNEEQELALAVSRSGDSKEALQGPLIYCLITVLFTLIFWRDSMTGIMALSTMAAGDGVSFILFFFLFRYYVLYI
jgi:hypothetical protein